LPLPGRGAAGEAELDYLFVADGQQGRGIGRALMADAVALAAELDVERIHIVSHPPSDAPRHRLTPYPGTGFTMASCAPTSWRAGRA
jgi:GNAT superfamily N-acetyltransferase